MVEINAEVELLKLIGDYASAQAELATLRAENERLRSALSELAEDPRETSVCIGDGWDFYTDVVNFARAELLGCPK